MNKSIVVCIVVVLFSFTLQARAGSYPFRVSLDGKDAVLRSANDVFAVIDNPVSADAVIVADAEDDTIFINIFASNERGEVASDTMPAVILYRPDTTVRLDNTMDGSRLEPGYYLMNVVAPSKGTSRVVFRIE